MAKVSKNTQLTESLLNEVTEFHKEFGSRPVQAPALPSGEEANIQGTTAYEVLENSNNIAAGLTAMITGKTNVKETKQFADIVKNKKDNYLAQMASSLDKLAKAIEKGGTIEKSFKELNTNIDKLEKILKSNGEKGKNKNEQTLKLTVDGKGNTKDILGSTEEFKKKFNDKNSKEAVESVQNVGSYLESLKKLFSKDVAGAAKAALGAKKSTQQIGEANDNLEEKMISSKVQEARLQTAAERYKAMAVLVAVAAAVMLIGAKVLQKNPNLKKNILEFTALLALFLTGIMLPIAIAERIGKGGYIAFKEVAVLITVATFVMMIGSLFVRNKKNVTNALKFTGVLAVFLLATLITVGLCGMLLGEGKSMKEVAVLITVMAAVMMIGALFMMSKAAKHSIEFGKTLGIFLLIVLAAVTIGTVLLKLSGETINGLVKLITTLTVIMIIGALFMMWGDFPKLAIEFGHLLMKFEFLVLLPFAILTPIMSFAGKTILALGRLIVTCTIVMSIGALFMMLGGGKFAWAAIKFGLVLALFEFIVIAAIALGNKLMGRWATIFVYELQQLLVTMTVVMLVGALFMFLGGGKFVLMALAFAITLGIFIFIILGVIKLGAMMISWKDILAVTALVLVSAIIMMIGAMWLMEDGCAKFFYAMLFAVDLGIFITAVLVAIAIGTAFMDTSGASLWEVALLIVVSGAIMMIGANWLMEDGGAKFWAAMEFTACLGLFIGAILLVITFAGAALQAERGRLLEVTALIAIAAGVMMVGAWFMSKDPNNPTHALEFTGVFALFMGAVALTLFLLSKAPGLKKGAAALLIVAASVAVASAAMILLAKAVNTAGDMLKLLEGAGIMSAIIVVAAGISVALGALSANPFTGPFFWAGIGALAALCGCILMAGTAMYLLALAVKTASEVDSSKVSSIGDMMGSFISSIAIVAYKYWGEITVAGLVSGSVIKMAIMVGKVAKVIADVAALKVPTGWDPKTGEVTGYRQLKKKDFKDAAVNVGTLITVLSSAIADAFYDNWVIFMGGNRSPVHRVCVASMEMADVVSAIAEAIANYANLQIVEEWDPKTGKPSKYRHLGKKDFKEASKNVGLVITTLATAMADVFNENPWMFIPIPTSLRELIRGGGQSPIQRVIGMSLQLADVVKNMAEGIAAYATMGIPIYDKEGNVKEVQKIGEQERMMAGIQIAATISLLMNTIAGIANDENIMKNFEDQDAWGLRGWLGKKAPGTSKFSKLLAGLGTLSQVVVSLAEGIASFATMSVPVYDKEGNIIDQKKIGPAEQLAAGLTIGIVTKFIIKAFNDIASDPEIMKNFEDKKNWFGRDKEGTSPMAKLINGVSGLGDVLSSFAEAIQNYAQLRIPTGWDKDGNATGYEKMTAKDFTNAHDNIVRVISNVINAIDDVYWGKNLPKDVRPIYIEDVEHKSEQIKICLDLVGPIIEKGLELIKNLTAEDVLKNADKIEESTKNLSKTIATAICSIYNLTDKPADLLNSIADKDKDKYNAGIKNIITEAGKDKNNLSNITDAATIAQEIFSALGTLAETISKGKTYKVDSLQKIVSSTFGVAVMLLTSIYDFFKTPFGELKEVYFKLPGDKIIKGTMQDTISALVEQMPKYEELTNSMTQYIDSIWDNVVEIGEAIKDTEIIDAETAQKKSSQVFGVAAALLLDVYNFFNRQDAGTLLSADKFKEISDNIEDWQKSIRTISKEFSKIILYGENMLSDMFDVEEYKDIEQKSQDIFGNIVIVCAKFYDVFNHADKFLGENSNIDPQYVKYLGLVGIKFYTKLVSNISFGLNKMFLMLMMPLSMAPAIESMLDDYEKLICHLVKVVSMTAFDEEAAKNFATKSQNGLWALIGAISANIQSMQNIFFGYQITEKKVLGLFTIPTIEKKFDGPELYKYSQMFEAIVKTLVRANIIASQTPKNAFDELATNIQSVFVIAEKITKEQLDALDDTSESIEKYVKAVNKVKLSNTKALKELIDSLYRLSTKIGDLDKFTDILSNKLAETLDKLAKQIKSAENTIRLSEKIQRERHELIDKSVNNIKEMLKDNTLNVAVTAEDTTVRAGQSSGGSTSSSSDSSTGGSTGAAPS